MRSVRVDHLQVGWYQCIWSGSSTSSETGGSTAAASDKAPLLSLSMTREMLDSQLNYQATILESVLLLFGMHILLISAVFYQIVFLSYIFSVVY